MTAKLDGTVPDYILIFIGINDLNANVSADVVTGAYKQIINAIKTNYPNAKVFCINLPNRNTGYNPTGINAGIKEAVDGYDNAYLVDMYNSEFSGEVFKQNSIGDNLHPGVLGMDYMTDLIAEVMEEVVAAQYGK